MIRDITIGQYYPVKSKIHELDPRTKILATFVYLISLFVFDNIVGYVIAGLFLCNVIKMSHVPIKFITKGLKAIFILLLITVIFNLFLTPGEAVWSFWKFKISYEGIIFASFMACRLVLLIIGASIMTLTTTPNSLTDGIESLLSPLKVIKVPSHEIAMMMSIALRFIPILLEETDKIMKAQMARGADFENGKLREKVKALIPILIPLFISAFKRAEDLACAMEARCYNGGDGRTKFHPLKYKKVDAIAWFIILIYLGMGTCTIFVGLSI